MLDANEPSPYQVLRQAAPSPFLLTADHAGLVIPRALGDLGVSEVDRHRHIGWDIGIAGVTMRLSETLDATAVLQTYSRLAIDCNRRPDVPSAFPEISETTLVPGNASLNDAGKAQRRAAIFDPYHAAITELIETRRLQGQRTIYVAMHSFTPVFKGVRREMEVALLYNRRPALSHALAALLRTEGDLIVAENDPYCVTDESDYGIPVHAEANGLDYLELEIRQDLIATPEGQAAWAARLARLLPAALNLAVK
jgi:predicted N-formylglutamate amidohydrolase